MQPSASAAVSVISQGAAISLLAGTDGTSSESIANLVDGTTNKYYSQSSALPSLRLVPTGGASIVTQLRLFTGNDTPERDPTGFILWGSNDNSTYFQIASGPLALPDNRNVWQ